MGCQCWHWKWPVQSKSSGFSKASSSWFVSFLLAGAFSCYCIKISRMGHLRLTSLSRFRAFWLHGPIPCISLGYTYPSWFSGAFFRTEVSHHLQFYVININSVSSINWHNTHQTPGVSPLPTPPIPPRNATGSWLPHPLLPTR